MSNAGQGKATVIPIERARAALEHLKRRNQQQVEQLQTEIISLREELAKDKATPGTSIYNNAPSKKRGKKYQQQLAKVRVGIESGSLTSLGRAAIKGFASCGDTVAESLQVDLVDMGLARRTPSGQVRLAA